ncbi:unnamed protein product [Amoebophrya sp. A25]|nr:unnamed protein product [Amoebophrya sp. A25]|eukprot:GSA25T00013640001.1
MTFVPGVNQQGLKAEQEKILQEGFWGFSWPATGFGREMKRLAESGEPSGQHNLVSNDESFEEVRWQMYQNIAKAGSVQAAAAQNQAYWVELHKNCLERYSVVFGQDLVARTFGHKLRASGGAELREDSLFTQLMRHAGMLGPGIATGRNAASTSVNPSTFGGAVAKASPFANINFGAGGGGGAAPAANNPFGAKPVAQQGGLFAGAQPGGAAPSAPAFGSGIAPAVAANPSPFGQQPAAANSSAFGQQPGAANPSPFGLQPSQGGGGLFGQSAAAAAANPSPFGQPSAPHGANPFGQKPATTTLFSQQPQVAGAAATNTSSVFGGPHATTTTPLIRQPPGGAEATQGLFRGGQARGAVAPAANPFGQVSAGVAAVPAAATNPFGGGVPQQQSGAVLSHVGTFGQGSAPVAAGASVSFAPQVAAPQPAQPFGGGQAFGGFGAGSSQQGVFSGQGAVPGSTPGGGAFGMLGGGQQQAGVFGVPQQQALRTSAFPNSGFGAGNPVVAGNPMASAFGLARDANSTFGQGQANTTSGNPFGNQKKKAEVAKATQDLLGGDDDDDEPPTAAPKNVASGGGPAGDLFGGLPGAPAGDGAPPGAHAQQLNAAAATAAAQEGDEAQKQAIRALFFSAAFDDWKIPLEPPPVWLRREWGCEVDKEHCIYAI